MTAPRLPASVTASLALHGAGLLLFLGMAAKQAPHEAARIVDGVDLLIAPKQPGPGAGTPKPKMSTMDFLKLALPSRPSGPQAMTLKLPETRRPVELAAPKLEERARKDLGPKLEALDLSRERSASAAKLDAGLVETRRRGAAATLAAMPRLEEVGRRRVANLPQALALEERRLEATRAVGVAPVGSVAAPSRRQAVAAMAVLQEAAPPAGSGGSAPRGLAALLPEQALPLGGGGSAEPARLAKVAPAAPQPARRAAAAQGAEAAARKGVEIEGPLADRKVVAYSVPSFPDWARQQGILEAAVSIHFTVDAEGLVMPELRVERSSGYGRLDKLAMESLRSWRFAPLPGAGAQWGVITFRFVLE